MTAAAPQRVRWGIAGTGSMAATMTRTLARVEGAELVAVGSRTAERATRFAAAAGAARGHASYAALVEDADLDAVYVATGGADHVEVACAALAAGKHVLVEKPFALDAAGAERIVAAARAADRFCMEAMWTRFLPAVDLLLERRDEIGDLRLLAATLGFVQARPAQDPVLDLGVYPLSLAHLLLGAPTRVLAATAAAGLVTATLEHGSGAVSQLGAASTVGLDSRLVLSGSRGRLELPGPFLQADRVRMECSDRVEPAVADPGPPRLRGRLRAAPLARRTARPVRAVVRRARGGVRAWSAPYAGEGYVHEVHAVHRALAEGRTECERMTLSDSVAVTRSLDAVRALAGRP